MTDIQKAFKYAAEPENRMSEAEAAWAAWFDCLREYQAAARNAHPLRADELFE